MSTSTSRAHVSSGAAASDKTPDEQLRTVSLGLLEDHMSHCVLHAAQSGDEEGMAKIREASDAIARLVRS